MIKTENGKTSIKGDSVHLIADLIMVLNAVYDALGPGAILTALENADVYKDIDEEESPALRS